MAGFNKQTVLCTNIQADAAPLGSGSFNANGQLLIGGVAAPNMAVAVPTASNGVALTLGQNSLAVAGVNATTTVVGVVELADNAETIAGTDTVRAVVPSGVAAKLGSQTVNAIAYGAGTAAALAWAGPLTDGQVLLGSTGLAPVAGTIGTSNGVTSTSGAGTFAIAGVNATDSVVGVVELATSAETTTGTDATRANTPAGLAAKLGTQTQYAVPYGGGSTAAFNWLAPLSNGQLVIGSTGAAPVAATISAGTGIAVATGAGSLTISSTGSGLSWNFVAVDTAMVANNGYVLTGATNRNFSLPTTCAQGTVLRLVGNGTGLWTITQAANQLIRFGASVTTTGVAGSLAASAQGNAVHLLCTTADLEFQVLDSVGNLNVT